MSFGPSNDSRESLERFQPEADDTIGALRALVRGDFIGGYKPHPESHTGESFIDRILITGGFTLKGQDRATWPEFDGESVMVCAHSLSPRPAAIKVEPGEPHQCEITGGNAPGACRCDPVEISMREFELRKAKP